MEDKEHHVHFSGGSNVVKENSILIQPQRFGHLDIHLGFLQLHHRYHVEFLVPWKPCKHRDENSAPAIVTGTPNPNCHIIDLTSEDEMLKLTVEFLAYKEKVLKEIVQITCCKNGSPLKLRLNCRVLGQDKGTPLLRNGIRSIGVEQSNENEVLGTKLRTSLSM